MLARSLAHSLDPTLFAQACGVTPDQWQADLLRSTAKRVLLLASRQVGKTTTTALKALHIVCHEPGALVVIVSPSQRQSAEMLRTVKLMHGKLEGVPALAAESVLKLELENNARLLALPGGEDGKTIRGLAGARLVIVDEASRVSDELLTAVRPMLATNRDGALIALTTPAAKSGFFYEAWHSTDPTWERIRVSATDCPRITPEFLQEERRALGETAFASEYGLTWHDDSMSMFSTRIIDSIFTTELKPLWT